MVSGWSEIWDQQMNVILPLCAHACRAKVHRRQAGRIASVVWEAEIGVKNIRNKNNNNSVCKNIQKYFDKNSKKNKRPLTGNKYRNKRENKIEHEIPVNMSKNNTNYSTKNNYYQNEKDKLMQKLKEL